MLRPVSLLCGTAIVALLLAMPARQAVASVPTLAMNMDNTGSTSSSGPNVMIGWRFSTASPISVSELEFWDAGGDGLGETHQVAIWSTTRAGTSADALLSATVLAGTADPLHPGSFFRTAFVTPFNLPAGDYVIGGLLPGTQVDSYKETTEVTGFAAASGITYIERRFTSGALGFSRPDGAGTGPGEFGPNFAFGAAVPEPSSMAVAALAMIGLTARGLRCRKPLR